MLESLITTNPRATRWLQQQGLPTTDQIKLQPSQCRFENDALFGIEIPVINSLYDLERTLHWLHHYNTHCDRFNETRGSFLLPDTEIKEMLDLSRENNIGITFALSPRPEYDSKSSFYRSAFGLEQGRQLNNMDAITASLEEALRLSDLGCRGLIVYDIAVLTLLKQMRSQRKLPQDMLFKASSHCMATNPFKAKLLQEAGANSVTMIHDASLAVLQETRRLSPSLILDVPIDTYTNKGGFIRLNEATEIVQIASPVILKVGASVQHHPYDNVTDTIIQQRVKRVVTTIDHIRRGLQSLPSLGLPNKIKCLPVKVTKRSPCKT